jgi:hypothetical protein
VPRRRFGAGSDRERLDDSSQQVSSETMPLAANFLIAAQPYDQSVPLSGRAACDLQQDSAAPRAWLPEQYGVPMLSLLLWSNGI